MSQQDRRLAHGANAAALAKRVKDLKCMKVEDLKKLSGALWDGIAALQSTDYVGTPEGQAAVNKQHDELLARAKAVDAEISKRSAS